MIFMQNYNTTSGSYTTSCPCSSCTKACCKCAQSSCCGRKCPYQGQCYQPFYTFTTTTSSTSNANMQYETK